MFNASYRFEFSSFVSAIGDIWPNDVGEVFEVDFSWLHFVHVWLFVLTVLFLAVSLSHIYYKSRAECGECFVRASRVLVVVAHPDDECMFFGPTIVGLSKSGRVEVHLTCLSDGNFYGEGQVRAREFEKSCEQLGVLQNNIHLVAGPHFPDDPSADWDSELVGSVVSKQVERLNIDCVITFDSGGVSGHCNHIAISHAVGQLKSRNKLPPTCQLFFLATENLLLKYISFFIVLFKRNHKNVFISSQDDCQTIRDAMVQHASQNVWFRKLFMRFSSYCYLNTLHSIQN